MDSWSLEDTITYYEDALRMCPSNHKTKEAYQATLRFLEELKFLKDFAKRVFNEEKSKG